VTGRIARILAAVALVSAALTAGVAGADPSPTPRPPTCAERYPAEGPAGVDLRLGCIARELVGLYTGENAEEPPRISRYLGQMAVVAGAAVLAVVFLRLVRGRVGRRLAPVTPTAWWLCPKCRSVNAVGKTACYSCGTPWTPDAPVVPTADRPETIQRFGGDRKSAGDRPGRGPDAPPP
jgi:hypothetical protein